MIYFVSSRNLQQKSRIYQSGVSLAKNIFARL